MRGMRFLIALLVVFAMTTGGYAEEKKWSDEAELSFVDTGGNTDVTTLSAKNLLKYKFTEGKGDGDAKEMGKGDGDGHENITFLIHFLRKL